MKFRVVKRFAGKTLEELLDWCVNELNAVLRELFIGLRSLTFEENFTGHEWEGSIAAGAEQQIIHNLRVIPTRFLILSAIGTNSILAGTTASTAQAFYVRNSSASAFTGKILVLP